ncbi:hypothetical protein KQI52_12920 [bacterium]|nr:hypothetical protein [bacterium]
MSPEAKRRLIPLTSWNDTYEWPTVGALRQYVFYAHENGFDKVIRRVGRRVLIDEAEFFRWVDERNGIVDKA